MLSNIIPETPFANGYIDIGRMSLDDAHTFWRQAILDCHIPITRIVGFRVVGQQAGQMDITNNIITHRHSACRESSIDLYRNFSQTIVLDYEGCIYAAENVRRASLRARGERTLTVSNGRAELDTPIPGKPTKQSCDLLGTIDTLLTSAYSGNHPRPRDLWQYVDVLLRTGTGYLSIADLTTVVREDRLSRYFPMASYYSLNDFIKIIPPRPGDVELRYLLFNGMTDEIMNNLVATWKKIYNQQGKEELEWLQSRLDPYIKTK